MIEVSDKHMIKSTKLVQWQEKLQEAASHGDEVLLSFSFKPRALHVNKAARWNSDDQRGASRQKTHW
jgi:hypothetical protein